MDLARRGALDARQNDWQMTYARGGPIAPKSPLHLERTACVCRLVGGRLWLGALGRLGSLGKLGWEVVKRKGPQRRLREPARSGRLT